MTDDTKAASDPYHMADRRIASCCGHPVNAHGGTKPNAVCEFERSCDGARWMCLCEEGRMDASRFADASAAPSVVAEPVAPPTSTIAGSETHDGTFASSGAASAANPASSLADDAERIYITRLEWRSAVAALRAVEAVRAYRKTHGERTYTTLCDECFMNASDDSDEGEKCCVAEALDAALDAVEAVQALLKGER